jgi:hypothetical protein
MTPNAQPVKEVLSRAAAAAYLSVCKTTLDRLNIPKTQVRRRVLYRKAILDQWLEKHTEKPAGTS